MSSILLLALALSLIANRVVYLLGFDHGKHQGWNDRYFQEIEIAKAKRNTLGQFKARERL